MLEIIDGVSHLDHGLTAEMLEFIKTAFASREGFVIQTIDLPSYMGEVDCGLYGPAVGDPPVAENEVRYVVRGSRRCASRLVDRPMRKTSKLTIIAGPTGGKSLVLFTSYGGPAAPREPGDATIATWDDVIEARKFWAEHALSSRG